MPFDPRGPHTGSDWDTGPGQSPSGFSAADVVPGNGVTGFPDSGLPQGIQLFLPEERPIPSAIVFETLDSAATAVVQANVFNLPAANFQVPDGFLGRISGISFYVDNLLTTSDIRFTVWQNRQPVQGFSGVRIFPGAAARVANQFDTYIRVPAGQLLEVSFTNNDGGSYIVGAALSGWIWPQSAGKLWLQRGETY